MSPDLTINSIAYGKVSDGDFSSIRQNVGLGVNLPRQMIVSHITESGKSAGTVRTKVEFNLKSQDASSGEYYLTSCAVLLRVSPYTTSGNIDAVVAALKDFLTDTDPDYVAMALKNREI